MSCHSLEHYSSCLLRTNTGWNWNEAPSWSNGVLGVRTLHTSIDHAITRLDIGQTGSHRVYRPGGLLPQRERQGSLVTTHTMIDIDEIDSNRFDLHPGLALS